MDYTNDGLQNSPGDRPFQGYAGFWKRYAASFIDGIILTIMFICMGLVFGVVLQATAGIVIMFNMVIGWLFFALFESSSAQATPGKMAVGIKVTDMDGNRISFGRASGRHFSKILSVLILLVGYIMAAFTQKKQGLHDIVSGCLVVNKSASRTGTVVTAIVCPIGTIISAFILFSAALFPAIGNAVLRANMTTMGARAKDIYISIIGANTEREPLGLDPIWPKTGKKMEQGDDISKMTFENSSDYFSVLYDADRMTSPESWSPYVVYFDFSKCAGAGVPVKQGAGRLTAENNAWTIAANITDDMLDIIPVIISRNVDPTSLIPKEGDLFQQRIRPSAFTTPFGQEGFVLIRKGGAMCTFSWRYGNLGVIYQGASEKELQQIREAFQKIKYLTP